MSAKVEAFIEFNGDFKKIEAQWDRFFKSIENKDILKAQTFNRYTNEYIKTIDNAFSKMEKKFATISNRMTAFVKRRMSMGAYGIFDDDEQKKAFIKKRASQLTSLAQSRYIRTLQERNKQEEQNKLNFQLAQEQKKGTWEGIHANAIKMLTYRDPVFDKMKSFYTQQDKEAKKQVKQLDLLEQAKHKTWQGRFLESIDNLTKRNPIFDDMKKYYLQQDKNAKAEAKRIETNKREEEKLRKKQWNLLLGKWGKLGIGGMIAAQAIRYISRGASAINQVAQTALGFSRTIEGGASEGSFFGRSLAAYQRAGISAQTYGSWKRNMQGQVGALKLGMGNAAPFMMLGVSALDKMDDIELEIEKRLQKLPAETSWALGSQLGLSYELWEAMYKGKIDRSKPGYDEDAIKAWTEAANNINSLITDIKTLFFNNLAPVVRMMTTKQGLTELTTAGFTGGLSNWANPFQLVGRGALDLSMRITRDGDVIVDENALTAQNVNTSIQIN